MGAVVAFVFNVALARTLGVDGTGIYYLCITVVLLASTVSRLGLDLLLLRTVSAAIAGGRPEDGGATYVKCRWLVCLASVAVTVMIWAGGSAIAVGIGKPELVQPILIAALAIPCLAMLVLHVEAIKGLKRTAVGVGLWNFAFPAACLAFVVSFAAVWGAVGATAGYVVAAGLVMLVSMFLWSRYQEAAGLCSHEALPPTRSLLRQSVPMLVVILAGQGDAWLPSLVLGGFRPSADVGAFSVAWRVSLLMAFGLLAVNAIAAPTFAELWQSKDLRRLAGTTRDVLILSTALAVVPAVVLSAAPGWVMSFFGPEFRGAANTLTVISLGQAVNVALGPLGYLLIMSGHERLVRNNAAVFLLVNLMVSLVLVPILGALGAAVATAASLTLRNLALLYLVRTRLGILVPTARIATGVEMRLPPDR